MLKDISLKDKYGEKKNNSSSITMRETNGFIDTSKKFYKILKKSKSSIRKDLTNMTKSEQYYVSKVANLSRKRCVDSEVIDENARKLEFETLKNIVNYFGGNLFKDENSNSYFKTINNGTSFDICIGNDIKKEDESITILTALGVPFFDGDKLTDDFMINISDNGLIQALKKYGISYDKILFVCKRIFNVRKFI